MMNLLIKLGGKAKSFYDDFGIIGIITYYGMFFFVGMCIRIIIDFVMKVIVPLF